ncbi:unnamed protein product [Notodromas monacha]|uniref:Cell wall hydrolase SleB domain-containing protein n=1 Tax=Notodromas monacha TaxID=399045 RepID=A0A7R9BDV1_9CRUS|nr:unnamed protein product [Notodromas monacha]CAG0913571.1 unnamed protein product [Notodromas monacha]
MGATGDGSKVFLTFSGHCGVGCVIGGIGAVEFIHGWAKYFMHKQYTFTTRTILLGIGALILITAGGTPTGKGGFNGIMGPITVCSFGGNGASITPGGGGGGPAEPELRSSCFTGIPFQPVALKEGHNFVSPTLEQSLYDPSSFCSVLRDLIRLFFQEEKGLLLSLQQDNKKLIIMEATLGKDYEIFKKTVYHEARGEPLDGQKFVAWTIKNRAFSDKPEWGGSSLASVCRHPKQFECWLSGRDTTIRDRTASDRLDGWLPGVFKAEKCKDPTGGVVHYHVPWKDAHPDWIDACEEVKTIGKYKFYRMSKLDQAFSFFFVAPTEHTEIARRVSKMFNTNDRHGSRFDSQTQ